MNGKTNSTKAGDTIVNGVLIPLEPATDFTIVSGSNRSYFNWTDPVDKYTTPGNELVSEWAKTIVTRKENSAPTSPDDGTVVLTELVRNQYATETYSDENLENDKLYYYSIFPITTHDVYSTPVSDSVIPLGGELEYKTVIDTPFTMSVGDPNYYTDFEASSVNSAGAYFAHYNTNSDQATVGVINSDLTCSMINLGYFEYLNDGISSASIGEKYAVFGKYSMLDDPEWPIICINEAMTVQRITGRSNENILGDGESINNILLYSGNNTRVSYTINIDLTIRSGVGSLNADAIGRNNNYIIALANNTTYAFDKDLTKQSLPNSSLASLYSNVFGSAKVDRYLTFSTNGDDGKEFAVEAYDDDLVQTPYTSIEIPNSLSNQLQMIPGSFRYVHNAQVGSYGIIPITDGWKGMWPTGSNPAYLRIDKDLIVSFKSINDYVINRETRTASKWPLIAIYENMLFTYVQNTYNEADTGNPLNGYLMVLETN